MTKETNVVVAKELMELFDGLAELVSVVKVAMADGFQPATDIPMIVIEAINKLPAAIQGVDLIDDEIKADPGSALAAVGVGGAKILLALKKA